MGIPAPNGGTPNSLPANDQANSGIIGRFTGVGPSPAYAFWGAFNVALWGSAVTTLTTVAGSLAATVASATGLAVGDAINSKNVPAGTTIGVLAGTNVTLALPPGATDAQILGGADAAASFGNVPYVGSVQLERSFDGGSTFIVCGVGGSGQQAIYAGGTAVSIVVTEPERGVLYRLNCTAYTAAVPINYRMSASGQAAMAWGVPGA
jgi:hypothetical protein